MKHKIIKITLYTLVGSLFNVDTLYGAQQEADLVITDLRMQAQHGFPSAQFELAQCYASGRLVQKDPTVALQWHEKAAEQGHAIALCIVAKKEQRNGNQEKAKLLFRRAALQKEPLSISELAGYAAQEKNIFLDESEYSLLKKTFDNSYIDLMDITDESYLKTVRLCRAQGAYRIGEMHQFGSHGVLASSAKAAEAFEQALLYDPHYDKALYSLAVLHSTGCEVVQNIDKAVQLLRQCSESSVQAQCLLGTLYVKTEQYVLAVSIFEKIRAQSAEAAYNLGMLCQEGRGTKKDQQNALSLFAQAARGGHADSLGKLRSLTTSHAGVQCLFGSLCRTGSLIGLQPFKALDWLSKALKNKSCEAETELSLLAANFEHAQLYLGNAYEKGEHVPTNKEEAVKWYRKACQFDSAQGLESIRRMAGENVLPAVLTLAEFFATGTSQCTQNQETALEFYKKAATIGCAESAHRVSESLLQQGKVNESYDWLKKAAELRSPEGWQKLKDLADTGNVIACIALADLYSQGRGIEKSLEQAIRYLKKAESKNYGTAAFMHATLLESKEIGDIENPDQIIEAYQIIFELYKKALRDGYFEAEEHAIRIDAILKDLLALKKPDLRNILFLKIKPNLEKECPGDLYYWIACIAERARIRFTESIQALVAETAINISKFGNKGQFARTTIKMLMKLVHSEEFSKGQLEDNDESFRITELYRLCRGVQLLQMTSRKFETVLNFRRADDAIRDVRIDVFNAVFKVDQQDVDQTAYERAVDSLVVLFRTLLAARKISDDMRRDNDWPEILGTDTTLKQLLTHQSNARWKNRIMWIARVMVRLDESMQANLLGSWAAAGHHCQTRAEKETYEFYIKTLTDKSYLDKENLGLEMRLAIFLAELRKQVLGSLIPVNLRERIHNTGYLERKFGKDLCLVGDVQDFNDHFENSTVASDTRNITKEMVNQVISRDYTIERMARQVAAEANNGLNSRIPYNSISTYLTSIFGESESMNQLQVLYDENGFLTLTGAKLLLLHFGYLEQIV